MKLTRYLTRGQPGGFVVYQQAKYVEALLLRERGKRNESGTIIHISGIHDIWMRASGKVTRICIGPPQHRAG